MSIFFKVNLRCNRCKQIWEWWTLLPSVTTHASTVATVFIILIFTQLIEPRWALLQQDVPSNSWHLNVTTTAHKPAGFPGSSDLQSSAQKLTCNTTKQSQDKRPVIEQVRGWDEVLTLWWKTKIAQAPCVGPLWRDHSVALWFQQGCCQRLPLKR